MECKCNDCQTACQKRSGWFRPGQVAEAAKLLNMTEQDFFDKYVCVDYYVGEEGKDNTIFVLCPAINGAEPGQEYPFDPLGVCTFFESGECAIHAKKPFECAFYDHTKSHDEAMVERNNTVNEWRNNQHEIERLLGRKPVLPEVGFGDMLSLLAKSIGIPFNGF